MTEESQEVDDLTRLGVGELGARPPFPLWDNELATLSFKDLAALMGRVQSELLFRGLSANGLCADLAEMLVADWLEGDREPASNTGWDVTTSAARRIQVKSRVIRDRRNAGQRQLSAIRSWEFDDLAIVLFSPDFTVWQAVLLAREEAEAQARYIAHVNGWRLVANASLLGLGHPIRPTAEDR